MRTLLSRAIRVDPSFHVGLALIVILAVIEVFFATSYYVGRARAARVSAQAVAAIIARPAASRCFLANACARAGAAGRLPSSGDLRTFSFACRSAAARRH